MLRTQGLQPPQLQEVARVTNVASLLYASPEWWGFTWAQDHNRLERMVGRSRRCGYQRAPPHLRKWPRKLTRAFSGQLHLTRVMFSAASFQGLSPLGTCAHAPMYMSFPRRIIVTSCPAFCTPTFIDCTLIRLI